MDKSGMSQDIKVEKRAGIKKMKEPANVHNVSCKAGSKMPKKGKK